MYLELFNKIYIFLILNFFIISSKKETILPFVSSFFLNDKKIIFYLDLFSNILSSLKLFFLLFFLEAYKQRFINLKNLNLKNI